MIGSGIRWGDVLRGFMLIAIPIIGNICSPIKGELS
ncbi:MAG: hypothetical protein QOJ41_1939 [Acidobacteriaceae bacterium]|jgi:hypothetical protein|nr:hypothetical protein [Acidobacteriaceae bacterium]